MEEIVITDVNSEDVHLVWGAVTKFLQEALDQGQGEYELPEIYDFLQEGLMHLWIAYNEDKEIISSVVCELQQFPRRKFCVIVLAGGKSLMTVPQFLAAIESWAKEQNANAVMGYTRKGLVRIMQQEGYREVYSVVMKDLDDRRLH